MFIRNFQNLSDDFDNEDLEEYGIITSKRSIFIFANKDEWNANLCTCARFALINECVYYGDKRGNITTLKINNSTINRTAIYFGTVAFEIPNNIESAYFTVDVGINKEKHSLHDTNEVINRDTSIMTSEIGQASEDISSEIICSYETCIIPPMFYNEIHMIKEFGEFGNFLIDVTDNVYSYEKIVDRNTKFYVYDINSWDSMKQEMYEKLNSCDLGTNVQDAFNVSEELTSSFGNALTQNSIFIYDSDANGFNKGGFNVTGGYIPNGKYIPKNYSVTNLEKTLKLFEASCHNLESRYGHVRIMCCPNELGNRSKIIYKDYNGGKGSPYNPINKDIDGSTTSAIDSGLSAKTTATETISLMIDNTSPYDLGF